MKRISLNIAKYTGIFLLSFAVFVGLYYLASVACRYITTNNDYVVPEDGIEIFVVSNGVHADICLPVSSNKKLWSGYFKPENFETLTKEPEYISFGWGDKGFFLDTPTWDDLTFGTAFKALFIPSATAIHVSYLEKTPQLSPTTRSFRVSRAGLQRIEAYILSYVKLKQEQPVLIDCCRYPNLHDNFYESNGSYHLFRTCNVWTNQVIMEAGVKTSVWTPFDTGILAQFEQE
ncbi:MAG: TIGR02117 family protein [Flavobacteriales bacterium]|nr:TIGR02117 family protein [Flavobacteriales bacterium]